MFAVKTSTNRKEARLRTRVRAPKANSVCEHFGGTLHRECLDFLIPFDQRHLKFVLKAWIAHFNHGRHTWVWGREYPRRCGRHPPEHEHRHRIPADYEVRRAAVLGGLHHEYWL